MTKPFASIRWKVVLAFFLIIGLSFLVMAETLIGMLGEYLFGQRIRQDRAGLEKWAVQAAPLLGRADSFNLDRLAKQAGAELGGRVFILDQDGKVQLDSYGFIQGTRLETPEVFSILVSGELTDYGIHPLNNNPLAERISPQSIGGRDLWVSYSAAGIVQASHVIGVILLSSSVREMMQSLYNLQTNMVLLFALVATVALVFGMVFSRILTKPIEELTRVIKQMSKGDFAARVKEGGSGELKQLAVAFNSMSERLETLDQARNQFVSNASHELKTPLATMKILLESIIYQPEMDQELRLEFLSDINREIDRLSSIVSDLLTLVQVDSRSMRLTREKLSLAALVKETEHRLLPMAKQKNQQISLVLQDSCDMYADKSKLQQVVYNLMENAVKYTPKDGQIQLMLQRAGRDAILTVSDNGPGIPKESLPHIFDRFYRVDKARSRESGGTGLGLSIVQQFVGLHGGSVHAVSDEGKGSSFIVSLPLNKG